MTTSTRSLRKAWQFLIALLVAQVAILSGCGCEEEVPPPQPSAQISISPSQWTITENIPPGITAYQKFTIKNKAKTGAKDLEIKSISLKDDSGLFTLFLDKCPNEHPDPERCKESECVVYKSDGTHFCLQLPVSLPVKLAPGADGVSFALGYKPDSAGTSPFAQIIVNSNTENDKDEEYIDTKVTLGAAGGEPVIEISGTNLTPSGQKEFNFSAGKTNIGKTVTEVFTIKNRGTADLEVTLSWDEEDKQFTIKDKDGKEIIGNKFTLPPASSAPANQKEITVSYTPTTCDSHKARLKVKSNAVFKKLEGDAVSSPTLYVRMTGDSPAEMEPDPSTLDFGDVQLNQTSTKTFTIKVRQTSFCDVIIKGMQIAAQANGGDPKFFAFGDVSLNNTTVSMPSDAKPITLSKGDELKVAVTFRPTEKTVSNGVIKINSNDKSIDPDNKGIINLRAGTERNDRPIARFQFICGEESSTACNKDDDLAGQFFIGNEKNVKVLVDSKNSTDDKNMIKSYKWEIVKQPPTSLARLGASCVDKPVCNFIVQKTGIYEVKLTITDDLGQEGSITQQLKVD